MANKQLTESQWKMKQQKIIDKNRALLEDETVKDKYPKLYAKIKNTNDNRGARKYMILILDLFEELLQKISKELYGAEEKLILTVSYRFIKDSLSVSRLTTVESNLNNLILFGLITKLTDEQLQIKNQLLYDSVQELKRINGNTITALELVEWTDEVLATANSTIIDTKASGKINKSMSKVTMNLLGYDNVITKTNKNSFSDSDIANLNRLYSWAYQKCYKKGRAGFFTLDEYKAQFGSNKINVGERKQAQYRVALCIKLDLVCVKATKANMTSIGTNKALNLHCHQKTVFIPSSTLKTT